MNTTSVPNLSASSAPLRDRALVLAGGGAAGNAWQIGLVVGLADAGVDLTTAELVIGTSAGATVAAVVTSGADLSALYDGVLTETPRPAPGGSGARGAAASRVSGPDYLEWSNRIIAAAKDAADMRRRIGSAALARDTSDGADSSRWRDVVAARLPSPHWPRQGVLIPAVEARTGEPVVFDRHSGIDLVDAVAASTSAMTPYRIGERRYLNGGYRRSENADLAMGFARVLVLSPFSGTTRMPVEWGMSLGDQVDELRAGGSRVETVFPDGRAGDVFNANALDPSTRPPAARAGHDQGRAIAEQLVDFWRGQPPSGDAR